MRINDHVIKMGAERAAVTHTRVFTLDQWNQSAETRTGMCEILHVCLFIVAGTSPFYRQNLFLKSHHNNVYVCVVHSYPDNSCCYRWHGCEWLQLVSWPLRCNQTAHLETQTTKIKKSILCCTDRWVIIYQANGSQPLCCGTLVCHEKSMTILLNWSENYCLFTA